MFLRSEMESYNGCADRYMNASAYTIPEYSREANRKDLSLSSAGETVIPVRPIENLVSELRIIQASKCKGIDLEEALAIV